MDQQKIMLIDIILDQGHKTVSLNVDVAKSFWQKFRGLSLKRQLPNDGLLFCLKKPARPAFWMLGMRFAIDIIWISENNRVIGWEEELKPPKNALSSVVFPWFLPIYKPASPIRYALEVAAGQCKDWRIDENTIFKNLP